MVQTSSSHVAPLLTFGTTWFVRACWCLLLVTSTPHLRIECFYCPKAQANDHLPSWTLSVLWTSFCPSYSLGNWGRCQEVEDKNLSQCGLGHACGGEVDREVTDGRFLPSVRSSVQKHAAARWRRLQAYVHTSLLSSSPSSQLTVLLQPGSLLLLLKVPAVAQGLFCSFLGGAAGV